MIRYEQLESLKPAKELKSPKAKQANGEEEKKRGRPKKGKAFNSPDDRAMKAYHKK